MAGTIFYSAVEGPAGVLDARKSHYGAEQRSSDAHAWLFRKMAWASASAYSKNGAIKNAGLAVPTGGGLQGGGLYEPGQTSAGRFLPKPHITNVKIYTEGDLGSLLKCDLSFTVYNLPDLNNCQPFFDLGAEITISYGWKEGGSGAGPTGHYKGNVYNFSWQVNSQGGFDCTCNSMGPGVNILSVTANPASDANGKEASDPLGNKVTGDTFLGVIDVLVQNKGGQGEGVVDADGIGCVMFPESWGAAAGGSENGGGGDESTPQPHYYVSLEKLVSIVIERVHNTSKALRDITIKCDGTVTKGNVPTGGSDKLVSGNPKEILFPAPYADYGGVHKLDFTTYSSDFTRGDLSKIMISASKLNEIVTGLVGDKGNNSKAADTSLAKFFSKVFDLINRYSGTRFKLTMSQNPKNPKEFFVVDSNYADETIRPYEITAVKKDSICRSLSLVSKVPSAMAAMAYVQNTSAVAPMGASMKTLNGEAPETELPKKPSSADALKAAKAKMDAQGPADPKDPEGAGPSPKNVNALCAALERIYSGQDEDPGHDSTKEAIPFPIDFSCTLDGIEGFVFGNVITTNYLPTIYKKSKVAFTITRVEHNIAANDWTTTLGTVCRIQPTY